MRSGDPAPSDDLKIVIDAKRNASVRTVDVVSDATRWLKAALKGAGVHFHYSTCEEKDYFGFAAFNILRKHGGQQVCLHLKIAEIQGGPFLFAEVRSIGAGETMFPFFGAVRSDDSRELLLHYIADFIMSTEP